MEEEKKNLLRKMGVPPFLMSSALSCLRDNFPVDFIRETPSSGMLIASRDNQEGGIEEFIFFYLTASTWEVVNRAELPKSIKNQVRTRKPLRDIIRGKLQPPKT